MRMLLTTLGLILTTLYPFEAHATDITTLRKGMYVEQSVGCKGGGSVSSMTFDGRNLSGHYSVCLTRKQSAPHTYKSTCLEGQGQSWPKPEEIEASPDKDEFVWHIEVMSPTRYALDGTTYVFCGE